jgi:hypothetical protein
VLLDVCEKAIAKAQGKRRVLFNLRAELAATIPNQRQWADFDKGVKFCFVKKDFWVL